MKRLSWWFRITGIIYIILGLSWVPSFSALSFAGKIPHFDAPIGGTAYSGFLDWMFGFGLDLLAVGVVLIIGSWRPLRFLPMLWLVVALELTRGIADDVYMIARGYPVGSNIAFIVLHAAIIVTGVLCWRAVRKTGTAASPTSQVSPAGAEHTR